jgi:chromosome segregation ATPase
MSSSPTHYGSDVTPNLQATAAMSVDQLRNTISRQNETIESLHAAASKYRTRLASLEQQLTIKQAENESQKVLATENAALRSELHQLREKLREVELSNSRLAEATALEAESQAQLGVKVQAYQRYNNFLQSEMALREAKLKALQEQVDVLSEEVHTKDRRITILVEKLRQHNIDPTSMVAKVSVPEATYSEMKEKLSTQNTTIELLREKLESVQEDLVRREAVIEAIQRENKALKSSISRLVAQINGTAGGSQSRGESPTATAPGGAATNPTDQSKLKAYHARRVQDYVSPVKNGSS